MPKKTLWFETPVPTRWDPEEMIWSKEGFHEVKFDYETNRLEFRTQSLGIIGLGANKCTNFPYRGWEIKPLDVNKTAVTVHGSKKMTVEFLIQVTIGKLL